MKTFSNGICTSISQIFKDDSGIKIIIHAYNSGYIINGQVDPIKVNIKDTIENNYNKAYTEVRKNHKHLVRVSDKEDLLEYIESFKESPAGRNRMGCLEAWYDPDYAIKETFTKEEIEVMSDNEINNLLRLACNISDGLY